MLKKGHTILCIIVGFQSIGRKDFFHARWLEIEEKTCGLSCSVIKHELDENMQISQVKKQNGKSEKLLASTRPLSALNQHIYKLHLCSQLPPNLVSFPNQLALQAENLSSLNLCLLLALFGGAPLVATTLTIEAWWNLDLLFMIKSA